MEEFLDWGDHTHTQEHDEESTYVLNLNGGEIYDVKFAFVSKL